MDVTMTKTSSSALTRACAGFNPDKDDTVSSSSVDQIKASAAVLITQCEELAEQVRSVDDAKRYMVHAISAIEEGTLWAVKAATIGK